MRPIKFSTIHKETLVEELVTLEDMVSGITFDFKYDDYYWREYTGLKDKNGTDIYEGDLIKNDLWGVHEIVWDSVDAAFRAINFIGNDLNLGHVQLERCRIIGNIYENPDLLTTESDK